MLKRHNSVYILSSKHTYRPMRTSVVAQLFYKHECNVPVFFFFFFHILKLIKVEYLFLHCHF